MKRAVGPLLLGAAFLLAPSVARAEFDWALGPSADLGVSFQGIAVARPDAWGGLNVIPTYRPRGAMTLVQAGAEVRLLADDPVFEVTPELRAGAAWSDARGFCLSVCAYGILGYRFRTSVDRDAVRFGLGVTAPAVILGTGGGGREVGVPIPDVLRLTLDVGGHTAVTTSITVGVGF